MYNLFLTIPAPAIAEWVAASGSMSITLDLQHGPMTEADLVPMLRAIRSGNPEAQTLVRLAWNRPEAIMRALDAGAGGLICPMIATAEDARAFVEAAHYPPKGNRSFGPFRAALHHGGNDYFSEYRSEVKLYAMIETAAAVENLQAIAAVDGLDGLYVGPYDLSVSLGLERRADFSDPELRRVLAAVQEAARAHALDCGVFTMETRDAREMQQLGYDFITCGTEEHVFRGALADWVGGVRPSSPPPQNSQKAGAAPPLYS